jgi:hypothetical protein
LCGGIWKSLCASTGTHVDHKIEAGELLRKHEAPRIVSETVRPTYREEEKKTDPVEERREREKETARRLAHIERMQMQIEMDLIAAGREESLIASGIPLERIERVKKALRERETEQRDSEPVDT